MSADKFLKLDTLSLHAGHRPDPIHGARAVPIYETTSYVFRDADQAAALFNLERAGHIYSRISNPTVAVLEERVAAMDHGVGAVCTATGHAALFLAIITLMGQGGHIVSSHALYGGTHNLFTHTLPRFGITTTFVHPHDIEGFKAAIKPETRLVYTESIGNPGLEVSNIPALAEVAHGAGLPLMVDATFVTPYLQQPIALGADLVVHSLTKWMGGHGVAMGGAVVDGGTFDWGASGKFPTITEPYAGYHGLSFWEEFGPQAFCMKLRAEGLRDIGPALNPHAAFTLLQGIETLPIRMQRHQENTATVLAFLKQAMADEKGVAWVWHPTMPEHPDHALANELLPKGAGSVISFGIQSGADDDARAAGRRFIEALSMISHLANVGDAKTLVIHPASTTHSQMGPDMLQRAGIGEEMIRLSVGLEDPDDIIADLKLGFRAALKG